MILFGDKLIKYNRYSSVAETRVDTLACKKRKCPQFRRQINLFCPRDKKKRTIYFHAMDVRTRYSSISLKNETAESLNYDETTFPEKSRTQHQR